MTRHPTRRAVSRRGFSLVEMLIALMITGTLLSATLAALDASFKSYQQTTESASTHVVARIVMQRLCGMIRTGTEFGPYPTNPLREPEIETDRLDFVASREPDGTERLASLYTQDNDRGTKDLWVSIATYRNGAMIGDEIRQPLLENVVQLRFILRYEPGPRLRRATVDLIVRPDDLQDAAISVGMEGPTIRLLASATPEGID